MEEDKGLEKIGEIFNRRLVKTAPAYIWQDMALRVIKELGIPNFKRSAVFKVCKLKPRQFIEKCLNDTKELCLTGERWKYFFKLVGASPQSGYKRKFITK